MTEALEYPTEDNFPNPFTSEFIHSTAEEFKVDPQALAEALAAVAYDYAHASCFASRLDSWRAARNRFEDTCRLLKKSLASWQKATEQTRDALANFGFNPNLEEPLGKMISNLEEVLEFSSLPRGNPGKAHKTPNIDLYNLYFPVMVLDEFWVEQKGRHLGHGFLEDLPGNDDNSTAGKLGDAGLLFAHKCLKVLEPKITRSNVSSCIRRVKKPRRHARQQ